MAKGFTRTNNYLPHGVNFPYRTKLMKEVTKMRCVIILYIVKGARVIIVRVHRF